MSNIELLEWDSNFFNRKIGKITSTKTDTEKSLSQFLQEAKQKGYQLIYLFDDYIKINNSICSTFNGKLVDTKIIFQKMITSETHPINKYIKSYTSNKIKKELFELAYLSGDFSRFKTDENFSILEFTNLYNEWLKNSVSNKIADEVFVYEENETIIGFVTISTSNQIGSIGLIAVDPHHQGKKIGSQLINHVEGYLIAKEIKELHVPTQKANELACNFYLKNNFKVLTSQNIYHFSL